MQYHLAWQPQHEAKLRGGRQDFPAQPGGHEVGHLRSVEGIAGQSLIDLIERPLRGLVERWRGTGASDPAARRDQRTTAGAGQRVNEGDVGQAEDVLGGLHRQARLQQRSPPVIVDGLRQLFPPLPPDLRVDDIGTDHEKFAWQRLVQTKHAEDG
jgi:hypothetical protein